MIMGNRIEPTTGVGKAVYNIVKTVPKADQPDKIAKLAESLACQDFDEDDVEAIIDFARHNPNLDLSLDDFIRSWIGLHIDSIYALSSGGIVPPCDTTDDMTTETS